jgi:hypothetical protein
MYGGFFQNDFCTLPTPRYPARPIRFFSRLNTLISSPDKEAGRTVKNLFAKRARTHQRWDVVAVDGWDKPPRKGAAMAWIRRFLGISSPSNLFLSYLTCPKPTILEGEVD